MKILKRNFTEKLNNNFVKNVFTLSTGVIVGQAINFSGMPIIGRLYTPEDIGDYSAITANADVISAIAYLGMMMVFLLPEKDEEARGLVKLVSKSTFLITTLSILLLKCIEHRYQVFSISTVSYDSALIVLWFYVVLFNISNICYAYVNRQSLYKVLFWNPIIAATVNIVLGIIFGMCHMGFKGYVIARLISFVANIIHLLRHANAFEKIDQKKYCTKTLLHDYKRFPLYQMPANLIGSMKTQIETQLIAALFSSASLGMYSMAMKILSLPVSLLAAPINRVYYKEASVKYNKGEDIGQFSFNILKTNIKIAIIPIVIVTIFGEWIFTLFLGYQWKEAGTFAAILGTYQLMNFCAGCLSGGFVLIRKNNINLFIAIYNLVTTIMAYFISFFFITDVYIAVFIMSLLGISGILISQGIFLKLTGCSIVEYIKFIFMYILIPVGLSWLVRIIAW